MRGDNTTSETEWVIDKLLQEGIDDETREPLFKVQWYNNGPQDDTWESEKILPPPLVAACRRRLARRKKPLSLPEVVRTDKPVSAGPLRTTTAQKYPSRKDLRGHTSKITKVPKPAVQKRVRFSPRLQSRKE